MIQLPHVLYEIPLVLQPRLGKALTPWDHKPGAGRKNEFWRLFFRLCCLWETNPLADQEGFHGIADILAEMLAICHLDRQWNACRRCLRIDAPAVAADQFNVRVRLKPVLRGGHGPIGEQVDHAVVLQIHQECAIAMTTPPCPVINANQAHLCSRWKPNQVQRPEERTVRKGHS
jgi:hypothetical protein